MVCVAMRIAQWGFNASCALSTLKSGIHGDHEQTQSHSGWRLVHLFTHHSYLIFVPGNGQPMERIVLLPSLICSWPRPWPWNKAFSGVPRRRRVWCARRAEAAMEGIFLLDEVGGILMRSISTKFGAEDCVHARRMSTNPNGSLPWQRAGVLSTSGWSQERNMHKP